MGKVFMNRSVSVREGGSVPMSILRSASVRENGSYLHHSDKQARNEKHRAMPLDEYNCHSIPSVGIGSTGSIFSLVDQDLKTSSGSKKGVEGPNESNSSSGDRWWLRGSRRRSARWGEALTGDQAQDQSNNKLEKVSEAQEKMPKWKQFLWKLKEEARKKMASKPKKSKDAIVQGSIQRFHVESLAEKQETKNRAPLQGEKQKPSVYPEPQLLPLPRQKQHLPVTSPVQRPTTPIWERRQFNQPTALDMRKVRLSRSRHTTKAVPK